MNPNERIIRDFIAAWSRLDADEIVGFFADDLVMVERLDRTEAGDRKVDLPCCGVFEMRDGRIQVWRDYFDMATYTRAMGG